jgi:hypothetical protein
MVVGGGTECGIIVLEVARRLLLQTTLDLVQEMSFADRFSCAILVSLTVDAFSAESIEVFLRTWLVEALAVQGVRFFRALMADGLVQTVYDGTSQQGRGLVFYGLHVALRSSFTPINRKPSLFYLSIHSVLKDRKRQRTAVHSLPHVVLITVDMIVNHKISLFSREICSVCPTNTRRVSEGTSAVASPSAASIFASTPFGFCSACSMVLQMSISFKDPHYSFWDIPGCWGCFCDGVSVSSRPCSNLEAPRCPSRTLLRPLCIALKCVPFFAGLFLRRSMSW